MPATCASARVRQVRAFEQQARDGRRADGAAAAGALRALRQPRRRGAEHALGQQRRWGSQSLVSTFHQEVRSGERFFDLLKQMRDNPGKFLPVLELMYLCLSLGFLGRYRLSPRGAGEIERVREETYAVIARQRPAGQARLSPHSKGLDAPYRPARRAGAALGGGQRAGLAIVGGLFVWFSTGLNAASDALYARMLAAPPAAHAADQPGAHRAAAAAAAARAGADAARPAARSSSSRRSPKGWSPIVGTPAGRSCASRNRGMFASGSATVEPSFMPLLERIGAALKSRAGPRAGDRLHRQPADPHGAFPSNFQLSTARAEGGRRHHRRAPSATPRG